MINEVRVCQWRQRCCHLYGKKSGGMAAALQIPDAYFADSFPFWMTRTVAVDPG